MTLSAVECFGMASIFTKYAVLGVVGLLLQIMGLLLFVLGFFPVKPALDGVSGLHSQVPGCEIENFDKPNGQLLNAKHNINEEDLGLPSLYDRLVFMVVDGLPAEFVLGRDEEPPTQEFMAAMSYTQNLLASGVALGYHAKAAPPTVTMPRLKAMTSGAIAGFLDVAYNFNTQALLEDNLIGQLGRAGWRMVMLGDETWLRLFPNQFERHDGVSSFYVKDTIEVDNNVTRHLDSELKKDDWNLLVLHYLGLDHVGHLGGRSSPLMAPKLKEMDTVITRIHQTLLSESPSASRTLLVLVSDHGMTDGGNHGGATHQETDALALFITASGSKHKFNLPAETDSDWNKRGSAYQVDLVPTMALLLGVPIPRNSVGALLQPLFSTLTPELQLRAMELNSWQLFRLLHVRSPHSTCMAEVCKMQEPGKRHHFPSTSKTGDKVEILCTLFSVAVDMHNEWSRRQGETPRSLSEEDLSYTEVKEAYLQFLKPTSEWLASGSTEKRFDLLFSGGSMMVMSTIIFVLGLRQSLKIIHEESSLTSEAFRERAPFTMKFIAVGGVCVHAASFGSSSLVEEEQHTWQFMICTLLLAFIRFSFQQFDNMDSRLCEKIGKLQAAAEGSGADTQSKPPHKMSGNILGMPTRVHVNKNLGQALRVCLLLILGRTIRGWHRSGVNWSHLPDIAKSLENGPPIITARVHKACVFLVTLICWSLIPKSLPRFVHKTATVSLILSAFLILLYMKCIGNQAIPSLDAGATSIARMVFGVLGATSLCALFVFPWIISIKPALDISSNPTIGGAHKEAGSYGGSGSGEEDCRMGTFESAVGESMDATGRLLVSCWCLLQLLLQQPVNSGPILLLLLQLLLTLSFFRDSKLSSQRWISVLTLHWLGASGHFGLGNSNTLATVDVAGAYIGLSSHSTVLSGILAFIITYASPLLYMQGFLLVNSSRVRVLDHGLTVSQWWLIENLALPCFLSLAVNSVVLTAFTVVLLLMQNHLFVWSVFSPKYLYIVATTICTYVGTLIFVAVGAYSSLVLLRRIELQSRSTKVRRSKRE